MTFDRVLSWFAALLLVGALMCGASAAADTWLPATTKVYVSNDGASRLTVTPRAIANPLGFFEDKVDGVAPAGQAPGGPREARGRLEQLSRDGVWQPVWDKPLVNDVSPVHALVAEGGDHVVTFDNWHSVGLGDDVVVIYGADGMLVRSMALSDILPAFYIEALPRTVSSLWWGGEHRLVGDTLILEVVVPTNDQPAADRTFVEVTVDLATGAIAPPGGAAWEAALDAAERRNGELRAAEAAWRERQIAPLLGPHTDAERDWHLYLVEAYFRLNPPDIASYPATKVLRVPTAENYDASLGWLRDALLESRGAKTIMVASPSQQNLARVLRDLAPHIRQDSLSGSVIYVAVGDDLWPQISELLSASGATIIQLDPSDPVPQRPERLPD